MANKERADVAVPAEHKGSLFLFQHKDVAGNAAVASFASASGAMITGYKGIVTKLDYFPVEGTNVPRLQADQTIEVNGDIIVLAKAGEKRQAATLVFDTANRSMTLGLLQQSPLSTIKFIGRDAVATTEMTKDDLIRLASGEVKLWCKKFWKEGETTRPATYSADGKTEVSAERTQKTNCYEMVEIPVA